MPQVIYGQQLSLAGVSIGKNIVRTGDHANAYEVSLPPGKLVTDWVKTDADTAACNLPGGHGYTNGDFDVYWSGGARYGVPGTISTNALTLDGGTGTDFPATATADVVVTRHLTINATIDGDESEIFALSLEYEDANSTARGRVEFLDADDDSIGAFALQANQPQIYDFGGGATNVITGDPITYAVATNGSSTATAILKIVSLEDSTP
jgi:hypothetical protein